MKEDYRRLLQEKARLAAMAFAFFTTIPIPRRWVGKETFRCILPYFPLCGLAIALLLGLWAQLLGVFYLGAAVTAAFLVAANAILTGGIHLDGLSDSADAVFSRRGREAELKIMSDPHIGGMGVLSLVLFLLCEAALLYELLRLGYGAGLFIRLVPLFAFLRCLSALYVLLLPQAKAEGMAAALHKQADPADRAALLAQAAIYAVLFIAFSGWSGLASIALLIALAGAFSYWSKKHYGGATGDLAGALLCLGELLALFVLRLGAAPLS